MSANAEAVNELFKQRRGQAIGRKDKSGQEKVIKWDVLKAKLPELEKLCCVLDTKKAEFSEAVKACAEESGLMASAIRKVVRAKIDNRYIDKKREADQLALVFDECNE